MSQFAFQDLAIRPGYPWSVVLQVENVPLFPAGSTFAAQFRYAPTDPDVQFALSTASGGLTRVSDTELQVSITKEATVALQPGFVVADFVRTDTSPPSYVGIEITIPVVAAITRIS